MVEYIKIAVFFSIGVYIYERIDIAFALIFLLSLIMVKGVFIGEELAELIA